MHQNLRDVSKNKISTKKRLSFVPDFDVDSADLRQVPEDHLRHGGVKDGAPGALSHLHLVLDALRERGGITFNSPCLWKRLFIENTLQPSIT